MPLSPDPSNDPLTRARRLRRDMTQPERALWRELRDLRRLGLKFRRQVPFDPYVVDFYEPARRLAIELDGESHVGRFEYDDARQKWLESQGLHVLRLANDDVVKDVGAVVEAILAYRERMV
ncbi:endonuclease domain-containing protein [Paludisphaera rhizosphaerae]|uniref:endonuclease domain-containing protein n=1 Tax=Paludisphaera rhizosphaerae TaxID=2711216 RepID=UPI0013EC12F0|nr:DUF559 domain-containing protein [Paludisphaera rhizosphaerae]